MKIYRLLAVAMLLACGQLYGQEKSPLQIEVQDAALGGVIKVRVFNKTSHDMYIWQYGSNSWGWGIWTFEFFNGNQLQVFVRRPDESFTVNVPVRVKLPSAGFADLSFDLKDGSWTSHSIPIFPAYPGAEDKSNYTNGCFAILSIPLSKEAKEYNVWTGTALSLVFPPAADDTTALPYHASTKAGADQFTDDVTEKNLNVSIVGVKWEEMDIDSCLKDLETKSRQADPEHIGIKFGLYLPPNAQKPNYHGVTPHRNVSLTLDNVPMMDILNYLAVQTNCKFVIRKSDVIFMPSDIKIDSVTGSWLK